MAYPKVDLKFGPEPLGQGQAHLAVGPPYDLVVLFAGWPLEIIASTLQVWSWIPQAGLLIGPPARQSHGGGHQGFCGLSILDPRGRAIVEVRDRSRRPQVPFIAASDRPRRRPISP